MKQCCNLPLNTKNDKLQILNCGFKRHLNHLRYRETAPPLEIRSLKINEDPATGNNLQISIVQLPNQPVA